ncbi:MAG: response regulator [Pseudomonadota bacterium]|nr:response regulator [Pseudomonadota bacterium]
MSYLIMIVEDEYWTARDLAAEARDRGIIVAGPTSSIPDAINLLKGSRSPDAAILDVQLRADEVFPLADMLRGADIPFVFATGYEKHELPDRFADIPHIVKPFLSGDCIEAALALAVSHTSLPQ